MVDRESDYIDYIVEYENGRTFRMSIARRTIRESDNAAIVIAAEKQLTGEIPKGKIGRIKRSSLAEEEAGVRR